MASLALQALVTASMLVVSPIVAIVLALRAVPSALQKAPIRQALAPLIPGEVRATYLSLLSLLGRVGFSLVLIGMSASVGPEGLHHAVMFGVVVALAILAVVVLMGLRASRGDETR